MLADTWTTHRALQRRGVVETNPLLRWAQSHGLWWVAGKLVLSALAIYLVAGVLWMEWLLTLLYLIVVTNNLRVLWR